MLHALTAGTRENVRAELRMLSAQGDVRWLELRARRYFGPDNSLAGVSGTLEDVTARRHAQEALRRSMYFGRRPPIDRHDHVARFRVVRVRDRDDDLFADR